MIDPSPSGHLSPPLCPSHFTSPFFPFILIKTEIAQGKRVATFYKKEKR